MFERQSSRSTPDKTNCLLYRYLADERSALADSSHIVISFLFFFSCTFSQTELHQTETAPDFCVAALFSSKQILHMPRRNLVSNIWEYFRGFHYLYAKIISFAHEYATVPID